MTEEQEKILMSMDMRTRRIEAVLRGDEQFKVKGLVDKVAYHNDKIKEFQTDKNKVIGGSVVLGVLGGFLSSLFHKIFPF